MIIKGNPAGNVGFWGKHLGRDDTNERAEVMEIRGLLSEDLPGALKEMAAIAAQSRSGGNFMYQANINPDQPLTAEQWREAVDTLEKNLGLEGHQRVVVEHEKADENGELRTHRHVIWNRVDVDTLRVADMGGNWLTHMRTARELENSFDHTPTPRPPIGERTPGQELWEIRAAERSGITPQEVRQELTELWRTTATGQEFKEAAEDRGYLLAKGDRRDFCIIDQTGDVHSLARRLDGVKAKDVRERMTDIDRDSLPTVAEARDEQRNIVRVSQALLERRESTAERIQDQWREKRDAEVDGRTAVNPSPLRVAGAVLSVADTVTDYITNLLTGSTATQDDSPAASDARAQRRAIEALENIQESMDRGEALRREDIGLLTPTHLENIYARGDEHIRQMIDDARRAQERYQEFERERER